MSARRALLLDAGNTVVYLDHRAIAEAAGGGLEGPRLAAAEPAAKRRYEAELAEGLGHDDGWFVFMRCLLVEGGATERGAALDAMVQRTREAHDALNLWRQVPPELPAALGRVREAGWALGIVSNSEGRLPETLAAVGLADVFEVIVDSFVEGVSKPEPEIFTRALARLGARAEHGLYAGDIPGVDVDGARAAGLAAALVDTRGHYPTYAEAPRYVETTALIDDVLEGRFDWERAR